MSCLYNKSFRKCLLLIAMFFFIYGLIFSISYYQNISEIMICTGMFLLSSIICIVISFHDIHFRYLEHTIDIPEIVESIPEIVESIPEIVESIPENIFNYTEYKIKYNKKILLNINTECTICLNIIEDNYFCYNKCLHVYHEKCLYMWLNKNNDTCPNCRQEYP